MEIFRKILNPNARESEGNGGQQVNYGALFASVSDYEKAVAEHFDGKKVSVKWRPSYGTEQEGPGTSLVDTF